MGRTDRYADILKHDHLITPICVIGCGAIGRNVALTLASMGFDTIRLVDPDDIDESNLGTQGWSEKDLGKSKVSVLSEEIERRYSGCLTTWAKDKVEDTEDYFIKRTGVFLCVDCMDVRKHVFDRLSTDSCLTTRYMIDTRMGAASGFVWPVFMKLESSRNAWAEKWFPQSEAEPLPCAQRSTLYCAQFAASLAVSSFVDMIRGGSPPPVHFNLFASLMVRV